MLKNRPVVIQIPSLEILNYLKEVLDSATLSGENAINHANAIQCLAQPEFTDAMIERLKKEFASELLPPLQSPQS